MNLGTINEAFAHVEPTEAADRIEKVKRFALERLSDQGNDGHLNNLDPKLFDGILILEDLASALRKITN